MKKNEIGTSRKKLNIYKKQLLTLTDTEQQIAIGLLLGDVAIQTQNKGKTYRLKFEQSDSHKAYIEHLFGIFEPWVLSRPRLIIRINKNNNTVKTWQFQTISHEAFVPLAEFFLNAQFKKTIKPQIANSFSALSLAYWFMDDGGKLDYTSNNGKGIVLNTQGFLLEDVEILKTMLVQKFLLNCWIKKNKSKPIIVISGHSYERMQKLIKPLIIPSMLYKFPSERKS